MPASIGANLRLDGEREFKAALKESSDSLKVLGSELKLAAAEFEGQEKSVEALTRTQDILGRSVDEQKDKVKLLEERLKEASAAFGDTDSRTKALQTQLNNASAELVKTQRELDGVTADLKEAESGEKEAGDAAEKAGKQAREGGEEAEKSGKGWAALGDVCIGVGAALVAMAAAAGAAVVGLGKALTDFSVQGAAYADDILTLSSTTGMSTQALQEYKYAAELVDVSLDTLTGSMTKNLQSMTKVQKGNADLTAAYDRLGVSALDAEGNLRDNETVYWELIEALGNVEDETERDSLAMQVLGKSARDLNPLIEAGSDTLRALAVQARDAGAVLSDDTLDAFVEFDDQLKKLESGTQAAKNALGTILLPLLSDLAGEGVNLLGEFSRGILAADGDLSKMSDVLAEVLPKALDKVMAYLPEVIEVAGSVLGAFGKAFADNLPVIVESAASVMETLLTGFMDALPQIIDAAVTLILTLAKGLIDNLPTIVEGGIQLIVAVVQGIAQALPELIPAAVDAVLTIVDTLLDNLDLVIDAAIQLIMALAEGLIQALPRLLERAPEIIGKLVSALIDNLPKIIAMGPDLILALVTGIIDALPQLLGAAAEIVGQIVSGILNGLSSLWEAGKEALTSIWEGLTSLDPLQWGKDLISNFVGGIKEGWNNLKEGIKGVAQGVKDFLGFSKPKEGPLSDFDTYAPDMMDLYIKGIRENTGRLQRQLAETFDFKPETVLPNMAFDVPAVGRSAGAVSDSDTGFVDVTIPLTLDGEVLSTAIARIQWVQGVATVRNLGASMPG